MEEEIKDMQINSVAPPNQSLFDSCSIEHSCVVNLQERRVNVLEY